MLKQADEKRSDFDVRARDDARRNARVIEIAGEIDVFTSHAFKAALTRELDHGHFDIVVDLSRVSYMDSTGLGVLVSTFKKAREHGGTITLVGLNRQLTKIFDMTGLCRIFDIERAQDQLSEV